MAKIILMTGAVFGTATITSDEIEDALADAGHEIIRPDPPGTDSLTDETNDWLVVCTSSTGNGDIPDDLVPLYALLVNDYPRIIHLSYVVVALGDSSYENFCGGGLSMDAALADLGAKRASAPLKIDALEITEPEEIAPQWVVDVVNNTHSIN